MFITQEDYIQISADALNILKQCNENNRLKAETRAMEEINSYIADKYDMKAAYEAEDDKRSLLLVGLVCDIALYYMVLSLSQRMGYEVRKEQYEKAIDFLKQVQSGKANMNLPPLTDPETGEVESLSVRIGTGTKNNYIW